ncbi:MAG: flagellar hook-basal body complex protein FliE [Sphingomonadaceae bacterium]|nr:flagellar hook-basal body complex protein FliE [Sphingomonadaceae bacterium]
MSTITPNSLMNLRSQILQQNAALQKAAGVAGSGNPAGAVDAVLGTSGGAPSGVAGTGAAQSSDFGSALKDALGKVNDLQNQSNDMQDQYERGETTDIAGVMLAREKASVGFEATLQVRNKLLSAYKDIMSMPV